MAYILLSNNIVTGYNIYSNTNDYAALVLLLLKADADKHKLSLCLCYCYCKDVFFSDVKGSNHL